MGVIAVFDIGKTNVKLLIADAAGTILEQVSTANPVIVRDGMRRHDLAATEDWLFDALAEAAGRHDITDFVTSGHGSAGVLVSPGDLDRAEPLCPMLDYEQNAPGWLADTYRREGGDFADRGSAIMLGTTHQARQLLWVEHAMPAAFAQGTAFLGLPQYWAWRLSGITSSEITCLAAQSDLWNLRAGQPSAIARRHGWDRLLPPLRRAWEALGPVRPEVARRTGLSPQVRVLVGAHDSSVNFYNYQRKGLSRLAVVSTGTWIVGLSDTVDPAALDPDRGMTTNADVAGALLGGVLCMGGREYSAIADQPGGPAPAAADSVCRLVAARVMSVPTFGADDGIFPGSAGRGHVIGRGALDPVERSSLGVLHLALLTAECLRALGHKGTIVLDGSYLGDPLYAPLVAALVPDETVLFNTRANGVASGAAKLALHGRAGASQRLPGRSRPLDVPGLTEYARTWRARAGALSTEARS
ncbi:FGGY family carbohydrate kinase [Tropicimonas sp.]|uniref:FGGY family carbohydrate kinase n=1 Tax=Tropicimonas sp. TaxID=2067044 RepID=UPI003A8B8541